MQYSIHKILLLSLAISLFSSLSFAEITRSEAFKIQTPLTPRLTIRIVNNLPESNTSFRKRRNTSKPVHIITKGKLPLRRSALQSSNREFAILAVQQLKRKKEKVKKALREIAIFRTHYFGILPKDFTNALGVFINMFPDELKPSLPQETKETSDVFSLNNALSMIINNFSDLSTNQPTIEYRIKLLKSAIFNESHVEKIHYVILHSIESLLCLSSKNELVTKLLESLKNIVLSHKVLFTDEEQNNV